MDTQITIRDLSRPYKDGTPNLEIRVDKNIAIQIGFDPNGQTPIDIDLFGNSLKGKIHLTYNCDFAWVSPIVFSSDGKENRIPYLLRDLRITNKSKILAKITKSKLKLGHKDVSSQVLDQSDLDLESYEYCRRQLVSSP